MFDEIKMSVSNKLELSNDKRRCECKKWI
jgi:hypothetical protein